MSRDSLATPPRPLLPLDAELVAVVRSDKSSPGLLSKVDDGSQEPDDATDDYYYPKDAYYYVKTADD